MLKFTKKSIGLLAALMLIFNTLIMSGCSEIEDHIADIDSIFIKDVMGINQEYYGAKDYDEITLSALKELEVYVDLLTGTIENPATGDNDDSSLNINVSGYDKILTSDFSKELKKLIAEFEAAISTDYIYDMLLTSNDILDIKYKLALYLEELESQGLAKDKIVSLLEEASENALLSSELVCRNGIVALYNAVYNNNFTDAETEYLNAVAYYNQASEYEDNEEIIEMMLACIACYSEVLKGLNKAGIAPSEDYLDDSKDTDSDLLPDGFELAFKLNPYSDDTDGDGLSDYVELQALPYCDPTLEDTDDNGIIDAHEDLDYDGLTNEQEAQAGSSFIKTDTDYDDLDDCFEVLDFGSSPIKRDTDDDGLSDFDEFTFGTDPNNPDTDGDTIIDSEELYFQTIRQDIYTDEAPEIYGVELSFSSSDNIEESTTITNTLGIDIQSSNLNGLIGSPIMFETFSEFSNGTIAFYYIPYFLGEVNEEDLAILWYNEEENCYKYVDSTINTTTYNISADITNEGVYLVVDNTRFSALLTSSGYTIMSDYTVRSVDTDGDGLTDEEEVNGVQTLCGIFYTDPNNPDTDGDGVSDGMELRRETDIFVGIYKGFGFYYKGYFFYSNPTKADTDGDGLDDSEDEVPCLGLYSLNKEHRESILNHLLLIYADTKDVFTAIDEIPKDITWYEENIVFATPLLLNATHLEQLVYAAGFKYDLGTNAYISRVYPLQKLFGYHKLIDDVSTYPFHMVIDCEPIRFFANGHWYMIELWKGQYGLSTGCEIGIYENENLTDPDEFPPNSTWWKCVDKDDFLYIRYCLIKKYSNDENDAIFARNSDNIKTNDIIEKHWWVTGFMPGEFSDPDELVMEIEITFKTNEMYNNFLDNIEKQGYGKEDGLTDEFNDKNLNITRKNINFVYDDVKIDSDVYNAVSQDLPILPKAAQAWNKTMAEEFKEQQQIHGLGDNNSPWAISQMDLRIQELVIDAFYNYVDYFIKWDVDVE